ncbi:hypothetical protein D3C87_1331670 [compost metagenome]
MPSTCCPRSSSRVSEIVSSGEGAAPASHSRNWCSWRCPMLREAFIAGWYQIRVALSRLAWFSANMACSSN